MLMYIFKCALQLYMNLYIYKVGVRAGSNAQRGAAWCGGKEEAAARRFEREKHLELIAINFAITL